MMNLRAYLHLVALVLSCRHSCEAWQSITSHNKNHKNIIQRFPSAHRSPLFHAPPRNKHNPGISSLSSTTARSSSKRSPSSSARSFRSQPFSWTRQMISNAIHQRRGKTPRDHAHQHQMISMAELGIPTTQLHLNNEDAVGAAMQEKLSYLQQENKRLMETVQRLEDDNADLKRYSAEAQQQRLVLETFEREGGEEWCDELEDGCCPVEPTVSFGQALKDRALWLVGLLLLQSFSGIILARNESLIADHPFIVYFLTMLVGAGGNAGNQASVRVIRGLALGTLNPTTQNQFLARELKMAISLSSILTVAGFFRAAAFSTPFPETVAITSALFLIVFSSICLGAVLPLGLKRLGVDPAHSSTSIQVIMDILGVILAVGVSSALLNSPLGVFVMSKLIGS